MLNETQKNTHLNSIVQLNNIQNEHGRIHLVNIKTVHSNTNVVLLLDKSLLGCVPLLFIRKMIIYSWEMRSARSTMMVVRCLGKRTKRRPETVFGMLQKETHIRSLGWINETTIYVTHTAFKWHFSI